MRRSLLLTALLPVLIFAADDDPATTILDLMLSRITPASDILWGADDPQTDAEWQILTDAANDLIDAFHQAERGGAGPNDTTWAANPKWQAYVDAEITALENANLAIAARDMDKLWEANDALYTPCEACHIDFNPAVQNPEY